MEKIDKVYINAIAIKADNKSTELRGNQRAEAHTRELKLEDCVHENTEKQSSPEHHPSEHIVAKCYFDKQGTITAHSVEQRGLGIHSSYQGVANAHYHEQGIPGEADSLFSTLKNIVLPDTVITEVQKGDQRLEEYDLHEAIQSVVPYARNFVIELILPYYLAKMPNTLKYNDFPLQIGMHLKNPETAQKKQQQKSECMSSGISQYKNIPNLKSIIDDLKYIDCLLLKTLDMINDLSSNKQPDNLHSEGLQSLTDDLRLSENFLVELFGETMASAIVTEGEGNRRGKDRTWTEKKKEAEELETIEQEGEQGETETQPCMQSADPLLCISDALKYQLQAGNLELA